MEKCCLYFQLNIEYHSLIEEPGIRVNSWPPASFDL